MKKVKQLILPFFLLLHSCGETVYDGKNQPPTNLSSKLITMNLIDSLGTITFEVPVRYDTNYSWVHLSDCGKLCDKQKYRWQPKSLPVFKESGVYQQNEPSDSIERLTISHSMYFPFHDGDTSKNFELHKIDKDVLISKLPNMKIVYDTLQKIGDRYFSIFGLENTEIPYSRKVFVRTRIKSNDIILQYELLSRKNDSISKKFIKNSLQLLKAIKISKGV